MAQPAAKIPIQNRQYTMSKNSSYTIISSLQISPKAGKVKPALPAIAILNPAGIPNLMPGPWTHTFSSTTQDLQKTWHKRHPALFNSYPKLRERKPGLQLNPLCLEGSKAQQLLHMASSDFLTLQIERELCRPPSHFHTSHPLLSHADLTENRSTEAKLNLFLWIVCWLIWKQRTDLL